VHDTQGGTTYCPGCDKPLIERDWHRLQRYELDAQGQCRHCGAAIAGRFGGPAPRLGTRHIPMRVVMK
jgi:pyruvate formate lyase activating enzyme